MSLQGKIYTKYVMALNKIVRAALKPNVEYSESSFKAKRRV